MARRLTTCTFCGVGCGLYLETDGNQVVGVYPSVSHPANTGRICVRGWHVHEIASSPERLKKPLLKTGSRFHEVTWDEALGFVADRITRIRKAYGPEAVAFLNSPRCSNEEAYLLQKLARAVVGTNNVHHGTGVYCNNSIDVLLDMVGMPASTTSVQDLGLSDVIVVDGVDLARRLPTIAGAVMRAKLKGARLIVVGTRRHRVVDSADLFVQIRPNTEALLYGAMAKVIVDRGLMDLRFISSRCENYEPFLKEISAYDLLQAAEGCGVPAQLMEQAALTYARATAATLLYSASMQERTPDSIRAIVNLALLTGNIGKPGAGLFALTEQNNLQGVCDMGMLPDRLPGYEPIDNAAARALFEQAWHAKLPASPGLDSRAVLETGGEGQVRALWLCKYDPVGSTPLTDVFSTLEQMELVVVQSWFSTPTTGCAHVILPTASFGEERVSFTSTERRIQLAEQVLHTIEGCTPAWQQIAAVARLLGADWNYRSAADVMDEIGAVVPFYSGASYDNLARQFGRQWPCTREHPLGTRVLFAKADGRPFRLAPIVRPPVPAPPRAGFPLTLVFGNSLYYWNQDVFVRNSETLRREYSVLTIDYPNGFVEINPEDAKEAGIRDGQKVRLRTASAVAVSTARVTTEVMRGTVFVPYFLRDVEMQLRQVAEDGGGVLPVRLEKETA